ncbi:hypothetical protein HNY73_015195 [Argiope bruennichi]|uniref:Uncharacterized protein n=1 Tax=Argiope bruennichi TaxID=94029 RepID=A0A8T0EW09_ARGBR|nr:hypothetical protein HNY73_015195 [Argiope bruennichi]
MEKLKNSRKQYRRLFTIAHSDFLNCENELTIEDKILKLKIVEEKAKLMVASEYEFRELLFASEETEENINNEIDISESYIDKWRILENKLHDLLDEKKRTFFGFYCFRSGADVAGKLITGNHLQLKNGITAIETKLGWTVIGRANSENTSLLITSMLTTSACITDLWTLDFWYTDPSEKKTAVELQEAARQHFLDTVKIENNRYIVSLPWIEDHLPLPDNFELSEKRLHKVVKRLKTEGLFEAYGAVFKEWLEEDIIEEVTKDESFYVDNCVTSVPNEKELELFIEVATNVMAERSFQLRGWESTCLKDRSAPVTNVLGLQWDKGLDTLGINMNSLKELCVENVTKKTILSAAHRIFDPIGATCPVALFPKLLLQKTWERKLNWEEEVDSNTREEFLKWMRDIFHLEKVQIPRHLKTGDANEKCSLHFFSDASMYAYAAVAFLRVETSEYVKVQLLSAKARVSPTGKKKTTIARLELLAATITARLASSITKEIPHEKIYLWSDSTTVITWIKREDAWSTFVQNRVAEIRTLTSKENWRHVPGSFNPADLPSRGCSAKKLVQSKWWEGPDWLYLPADQWPFSDVVVNEDEVLKERKKTLVSTPTACLSAHAIENVNTEEPDWCYSLLSQYEKIVRMIGWILRFFRNCKKPKELRKGDILDAEDFEEAEKIVIKIIQVKHSLTRN